MKKEQIAIRKTMQPGEEITIKERVKYDGFITGSFIRFYAGQEEELKVLPYVLHKGQKLETFFTFPEETDRELAGEDDTLTFNHSLRIELDDEIHVRIRNTNTQYEYTAVVYIDVTYETEERG